MIGNDIIDLDLARKESNWKRHGFLDKIFTKKEQLLILNSKNPEIMVWNLWSRKEAAYKIYNRNTKARGYFPLRLECFDLEIVDGKHFGKVVIDDVVYFSKTEIKSQFINTIAVENRSDFNKIKILKTQKKVQKINGIPSYLDPDSLVLKPMSISHHGRFEQIIVI